MRVLLTGATGFVGSHVLGRLLEDGQEVAALLRPGADRRRVAGRIARATVIEGDLADLPAIESSVTAFGPEVVIHLAWSGVAGRERNDPRQIENVDQAVGLVHLAHHIGARRWIGVGSQAEYGPRDGPIREGDPTRPTTLYGAAKLAACVLSGRLCASLGLEHAWLRLFSSYGPGDDPAWLIPSTIQRLLDGERPALTAGEQRWDFLHVADAAEAIARVAVTPGASGVYNLGSGVAVPLREVIERLRDHIDPALPLGFGDLPYRPDQVMHLEANIGRLRDEIGWSPRIPLDEGLGRTLEWYREQRADRDD